MGQKKTLTLTTSWLRPVLELLHTVVLLDVCFLKKHQLQRPTKERPGFSLELRTVKEAYPDNFRLDYALSREQENKKGGKMYIQDKVEEYADEIFSKLDKGAHIYFCGLKGMMP